MGSAATAVRIYEGRKYALQPVYRAAESLGLQTTDSDDWNILWSYKTPWVFDTLNKRRKTLWEPPSEPPAFVVNHMPGTISLASKAHLGAFANALREASPQRFGPGTLPESYLLPEQLDAFAHAVQALHVYSNHHTLKHPPTPIEHAPESSANPTPISCPFRIRRCVV